MGSQNEKGYSSMVEGNAMAATGMHATLYSPIWPSLVRFGLVKI